ncbi:hypothetical protein SNE40_017371 [Patella caerulea]|uniref:Uncharacterized protein n=1 Tax=Patella caerulea TaxID=87958 RepID=A0AAN8JGZ8_PATCE
MREIQVKDLEGNLNNPTHSKSQVKLNLIVTPVTQEVGFVRKSIQGDDEMIVTDVVTKTCPEAEHPVTMNIRVQRSDESESLLLFIKLLSV